jgi:hypothetical protein
VGPTEETIVTDFPQGAERTLNKTYGKSAITKILNKLKEMPFQDVVELTEWLLKQPEDAPIRPRTDSERTAYESGMATGIELCAKEGVQFAVEELKLMLETREAFRHRRNRATK